MSELVESEWNRINDILLELYSKDDERKLAEEFLRMIKRLISYTQGFFIMCDEEDKIIPETSFFLNVSDENKQKYIDLFYKLDYIKYIYGDTRTITFRDSDILEDLQRKQTIFYRDFLRPQNMDFGCGIVFVKNQQLLGTVNLFRSKEMGNFSEKDIEILNKMKDHLTNITYSLRKSSLALDGTPVLQLDNLQRYNLSKREHEITSLMLAGNSNQEISDKLCISLSTVKKHIYNIFTKLGINSRMQLLTLFKQGLTP